MSLPHCIITGCALIDRNHGKWIWGDLHQMGDRTFIFNASGNSWNYEPLDTGYRAVLVYDYYEKNSVIVFTRESMAFNSRAIDYLGDSK